MSDFLLRRREDNRDRLYIFETCSALGGGSVWGRLPLSVQPVGWRWTTYPFNNGLPPGGAIDSMISAKHK